MSANDAYFHASNETFDEITNSLLSLQSLIGVNNPDQSRRLESIQTALGKLKNLNTILLEMAGDMEKIQPAVGIANQQMAPLDLSINSLIQDTQSLAEELDDDGAIYTQLNRLSLNLISATSRAKQFLLDRSGSSLEQYSLYANGFNQGIEALRRSVDDDDIADLIEEIAELWGQYDALWQQAVQLHQSAEWRRDAHFIHTEYTVLEQDIERQLESLVQAERAAIDETSA